MPSRKSRKADVEVAAPSPTEVPVEPPRRPIVVKPPKRPAGVEPLRSGFRCIYGLHGRQCRWLARAKRSDTPSYKSRHHLVEFLQVVIEDYQTEFGGVEGSEFDELAAALDAKFTRVAAPAAPAPAVPTE